MKQSPDIIIAALECEPTAHCSIIGKQLYSNIVWNPEVDPAKIPSQVDVEAKLVELQTEYDAKKYQRDRADQYPSIQDVIVALAEKEEGDDTMWKEITAKRQKVKADHPKGIK